ncbi:hypothetical protein B0H13DRAFT_804679 [Mycena leptocephala]|nr:hypothetical protein B0H13DRAFT_804679 [Mycena leptocephala]
MMVMREISNIRESITQLTTMFRTEKVYAVIGGTTPGVHGQPPFLVGSSSSPIFPIVIKCNSNAQANEACGIHTIFESLGYHTAEKHPDAFAMAIASSGVAEVFQTNGPFYAVYRGRERGIFLNYPDVEAQVHDFIHPRFRKFENIRDALVYMILKGDVTKMQELGLYPKGQSS